MNKKIHQDVFIGIIFIFIAGLLYIRTYDFIEKAALFPRILLAVLVTFSVFIIYKGIVKTKRLREGLEVSYEGDEQNISVKVIKSPFITVLFVIIYVFLLNIIGFFPSTIAYIAFYLWYKEIKDWKVYLYILAGVNIFIYLLFVIQLQVQLPVGIFFE